MKKSVRLNKEIRTRILTSIMDTYRAKNPLPAEPNNGHHWLAESVYSRTYGELDVGTIPESLLDFRSYILVSLKGGHLNPNFEPIDGKTPKRPFAGHYIQATPEEEAEYTRINKDNRKIQQVYDKAVKDQDTYREEVRDVLNSVSTSNQLIELWPEVEQFIPSTIRDPSSIQLPAISVASLNDALK
jgi:hypothetical protein